MRLRVPNNALTARFQPAGGCSASAFGGERVLPEQEDQTAAGPHRGEGHPRRRNQGHEGYARSQGAQNQCPAEEGERDEEKEAELKDVCDGVCGCTQVSRSDACVYLLVILSLK